MKTALLIVVLALAASMVGTSSARPAPSKALPEQASERAQQHSRNGEATPPPLPTAPPIIPPILVAFTGGQTGASAAAIQAADQATVTVNTKIATATTLQIITMTAQRGPIRTANIPPLGRAGDLETTIWNFNARQGNRIGKGNLLCRWATLTRRLCWGEIRLPRGRLIMIGSSQTRQIGSFAIVGGTGFYLFKQGVLTFSAQSRTRYAVRVVLA